MYGLVCFVFVLVVGCGADAGVGGCVVWYVVFCLVFDVVWYVVACVCCAFVVCVGMCCVVSLCVMRVGVC